METELIISALLLLFCILSGIWLSLIGRPLNRLVFSIHKVTAVAAVVIAVITVVNLPEDILIFRPVRTMLLFTGISLLAAFVSGSLLSFDRFVNNILKTVHKLSPYLIVSFSIVTLYLSR